MGVVSLKGADKALDVVSVRLCEESGDHIDTTCDFNVSCVFFKTKEENFG